MIRKLTRKDRKTLTAMIEKMAAQLGDKSILKTMISDTTRAASDSAEEAKSDTYVAMGVKIFKTLYSLLEDDFCGWLADLCGMTIEEYDAQPFDIDIQVMNEIVDQKEFSGFFTGASVLASKTRQFVSHFKSLKG